MELKPEPVEGDEDIKMEMEIDPDLDLLKTPDTKGIKEPAPLVQVDLSEFSELLSKLESSSGTKLLKIIFRNFKQFCKLVTSVPLSSPMKPLISQVVQELRNTSQKLISNEDKREKLLSKVSLNFSCENELFKTFLKYGMKHSSNDEGGHDLISVLTSLFNLAGAEGKIIDPILGIQMVLSHSKAEEIFLEFHKVKNIQNFQKIEKNPEETDSKPKIIPTALKFSKIKTELLKLWRILVKSFSKISKLTGTPEDKKVLENSVPYLFQMYGATLSLSDREIFSILELYSGKKLQIPVESMPLFGPKCFEAKTSTNPLYAHSIRANSILAIVNDTKAFETGMKYKEEFVASATTSAPGEDGVEDFVAEKEELYDMRFVLPLVCHLLDEKNICDVVKVITNGWIYFIVRGMSFDDPVLRSVAFLAYKRLIFNLHLAKGFRLQDVKVWLHFLLGVKNGLISLEECRLPTLISIWMVATCEVLRQPSHQLYPKVTHFLLAKPTIDLSILPDFISFFNAVDGNRESREWILTILLLGLTSKKDWDLAKKVPTVMFMCSLFPLEKIQMQRVILKILANGAKIPEVACDMVDRHGMLLWIANIKLDEKFDKSYYRRELGDLYRNLSLFCPPGQYRDCVFRYVAKKHGWEYLRQNQDVTIEMDN